MDFQYWTERQHLRAKLYLAVGRTGCRLFRRGRREFSPNRRFIEYDTSVAGHDNIVSIATDFMLGNTGNPSAWRYSGFYSSGNTIGTLEVLKTGAVNLGGLIPVVTLTRGAWYNLRVDFNFTTLLYTGYIDGVSIGTQAFSSSGATTQFGSILLSVNTPGTDRAYFDNVSVSSFSSTPEPGTMVLLLTGLAFSGRRLLKNPPKK